MLIRDWALARWEEGTIVDFVAKLGLKKEIQVHLRKVRAREAEEETEASEGSGEC